jgi:hypothetical protein
MNPENIDKTLQIGLIVMAAAPHVAAIVGTPMLIARIGLIAKIFNFLAGNYLKAKNAK